MNFFSRRLPAMLIGAAVVVVEPQLAVALTPVQVNNIAKEFTVLITGKGTGSGVIFERKGDTYSVMTNQHVVAYDGRYEIQTPDGIRYPVYHRRVLPGLDIAILQFTSNKKYNVGYFWNSDQIQEGTTVYVAGWAVSLPGITNERHYQFTKGKLRRSQLKNADNGYALVYDNEAKPGMSGGPVLDENGHVVGINGRANTEVRSPRILGLRLGIPINSVLTAISRPTTGSPAAIAAVPQKRTAEALISLGGGKADRKDYQGAIADYNQALLINPNNPDAYFQRGSAYYYLKKYEAVLEDFNKVLQLNPESSAAYISRGNFYAQLGEPQKAIADFNQAKLINPNIEIPNLILVPNKRINIRILPNNIQNPNKRINIQNFPNNIQNPKYRINIQNFPNNIQNPKYRINIRNFPNNIQNPKYRINIRNFPNNIQNPKYRINIQNFPNNIQNPKYRINIQNFPNNILVPKKEINIQNLPNNILVPKKEINIQNLPNNILVPKK
ncbi:MAG: serine protease, partial [Iphinoe sp. HA4291-MV1]|nr:serine protease [Iphinoe sp. HA4291-MV1]